MENWLFNDKIRFNSRYFQRILDFYLFHCPVDNQSVRGKNFSEFGWSGQKRFAKLKALMLSAASSELKDRYKSCNKNDIEDVIKKFGLNIQKPNLTEAVVFLSSEDRTVMGSLYRAIRHSLAHGSFTIMTYNKERYYLLENFDGYCKARLILKESTLLKWVSIVKEGYR